MTKHRNALSNERGFALFYMAVFLTVLLIFVGLAVDTGRAYVVQAQLSKAVDGAALGAARMLNSGNPQQEAGNIYRANFPAGWMGTTSSTSPGAAGFYSMTTDATTGVNRVNVSATAVVPTTFMKLANFTQLTVHAQGEATRRMVDLSLVLDVSGSIGWRWPYVRDAARTFVDAFDQNSDRVSLVMFGNGARVVDAMPAGRGFDKARVMADIPNSLPGGSTAMVQGLYRGWDELRSVPNGQQSGLRIIVLFTDGCSNSVPGIYNPGSAGTSRGLRTYDFPDNGADPDSQTHLRPNIEGLYPTDPHNGCRQPWRCTELQRTGQPGLAKHASASWRAVDARQFAIVPLGAPELRAFRRISRCRSLPSTVNGVPQNAARGLRNFNAGAEQVPGRRLEHQQRGAKPRRDHCQCRAHRHRGRLPDSHLHDRHG